jgi:hypothetical protein
MPTRYELAPCPACGAAAADEIADVDAVKRELEALWSFHTRRLRPDTPPRHLSDRVVFSQQPPLRLGRCVRCGTIYRNPRETAAAVATLYRDERLDPAVARALFEAQRASYRRQARRLTRMAGRTGAGLEVGSYVGGFLRHPRAHRRCLDQALGSLGGDRRQGAAAPRRTRTRRALVRGERRSRPPPLARPPGSPLAL